MAKRITLPTGAEAEVVEHAPGEWFGRVPAALEDWDGTGAVECKLAETEALWAEQIARNGEARKNNARKVTVELIEQARASRLGLHRAPTMTDVAAHLGCEERTIRRVLKAAGLSWRGVKK